MPPLPPASDFTAAPTQGAVKTWGTALTAYLAGLFGTDGALGTALRALGVPRSSYGTLAAATAVTAAHRGRLLDCSGTWTLGLLAVAAAGEGFALTVRNAGAGTITIDPAGSELVDGATALALGPGQGADLLCTGSAWVTTGLAGRGAGPLALADGAVAAPALAFAGDLALGLYRAGAGVLGLAAGGAALALLSATGLAVNVPITGTAVQSGGTDATDGRLLRVDGPRGAFGWGASGSPPALADLDDATSPSGLYVVNSATTLAGTWPPGVPASTAALVVKRTQTGGLVQEFTRLAVSNGVWTRRYTGGAWAAWERPTPLVGPVSQAGGVPTGAVVEAGSGANGSWTRFADGRQIFEHTMTLSATAGVTWTFPATSVAPPRVHGTAQATVLSSVQLDAAPSATSCVLSARDKADARRADVVHLTGNSRWY